MDNRLLYRIAEAAEILGVSGQRRTSGREGEIPSVRLGGTVRVPAAALKLEDQQTGEAEGRLRHDSTREWHMKLRRKMSGSAERQRSRT